MFGIILSRRKCENFYNPETLPVMKKIIWTITLLGTVSAFFSWYIYIQEYGSLEYIFLNAMKIRVKSIGQADGIIPVYFTYMNATVLVAFALALSMIGYVKENKYKFLLAYLFTLIFFCDLLTFGRIGILYSVFMVFGYWIVYKKKIVTKSNVGILSLLLLLFSLPRLIRGSFDNFSATMNVYAPYLHIEIPPIFNSLVSIYIYYFSAPYALSDYLDRCDEFTYGTRNFAPLYNIIYRFLSVDKHVVLIDGFSEIPFEYNIYTVIRDFYGDFGIIGVVVLSLMLGIYLGRLFSMKGAMINAIKIYMIGWIFYSPVYNPFMFGGFFLAFVLLNIISIYEWWLANGKHNYS